MESSCSLQMPHWLAFLLTVCAVAEGAVVKQAPRSAAAACVSTVLSDPQRRIAVMGGREGMKRSLGSVCGGAVTRFLGGFRGGTPRVITMKGSPHGGFSSSGVAVSRDGSMLLVSDAGTFAVRVFAVHTGAVLRTIGSYGSRPLQFRHPCQIWVASDGFVFVADFHNHCVQVLTPLYEFHSFVGVGELQGPYGVCADDDVIVVSVYNEHRISVFKRENGALIRSFGHRGSGDGQLKCPASVCFMSGHRRIAVADFDNNRVSVWTLEGEFVHHVGVGELKRAACIACSDANELVVADRGRIVVFSASGEIVWTSGTGAANIFRVTVHGSTIFGHTGSRDGCKCFLFS